MNANLINCIGVFFDIIGAVMIWRYTPSLFEEDKNNDIQPTDSKENQKHIHLSETGIILIIIGFIFQLAGNIMQWKL